MVRFILLILAFLSILFFMRRFFSAYRRKRPDLFPRTNTSSPRKYDNNAVEAEFEEIK